MNYLTLLVSYIIIPEVMHDCQLIDPSLRTNIFFSPHISLAVILWG